MNAGLSELTAVGRFGGYREWADHSNGLQLVTCGAREADFYRIAPEHLRLGGPVLPHSHTRTHLSSSWTGVAYRYTWDDDGFDLYLKTTLPGPLLIPHRRVHHFRWAVDNGVPTARSLDKDMAFRCAHTIEDPGQLIWLQNWGMPTLLVSSLPITRLQWVSHEHMTVEFAAEGAYLLLVPLLNEQDIPRDEAARASWLCLVQAPPVSCAETFEVQDDRVVIRQAFTAPDGAPAAMAPVPPLLSCCADHSAVCELPASQQLVHGLMGAYSVIADPTWSATIRMDWSQIKLTPTRAVDASGLAVIPEELAYAGDVTWQPGSAMDQLLALRVWAPLAGVCPPAIWQQLQPQLSPPTATQFRDSLAYLTEPRSGRRWAKEANLFETCGDVAYDTDWYSGFELSGLWRACTCADATIAEPARKLAREAREERQLLTNYFAIFHDWELCAAMTDARGVDWNCDCSHNGLEGLLAQAAMCRVEGDAEGADFATYLAAKTACALLAAEWLVDYLCDIPFLARNRGAKRPVNEPTFGMQAILLHWGALVNSPSSKSPYALAGNFPAYNLLMKRYGHMERYREVASLWEQRHPERYEDWIVFYIGRNPRLDTSAAFSQEERIQAAVMYHLAPEVGFRLWTLDEDPTSVETRFKTPLNLAEQLYCRAGMRICVE